MAESEPLAINRIPDVRLTTALTLKAGARERWNLTREAFERLLQRLDPDRQSAAEAFRDLQSKLVLFFTYNRCKTPDRWADVAMDRVAKRLAEEQSVPEINPFAYGVARLVLLEAQREEQRERELLGTSAQPATAGHDEDGLECLDRCIGQLSPENRNLILRYYAVRQPTAMRDRLRLAFELGISIEALRTRALRIRKELEQCVGRCREDRETLL